MMLVTGNYNFKISNMRFEMRAYGEIATRCRKRAWLIFVEIVLIEF